MPLFKNKIKKSRKSIIGNLVLLNKGNSIVATLFGINYFIKSIGLKKGEIYDPKAHFLLEFSEKIKLYYIFKFESKYTFADSYFNLFK